VSLIIGRSCLEIRWIQRPRLALSSLRRGLVRVSVRVFLPSTISSTSYKLGSDLRIRRQPLDYWLSSIGFCLSLSCMFFFPVHVSTMSTCERWPSFVKSDYIKLYLINADVWLSAITSLWYPFVFMISAVNNHQDTHFPKLNIVLTCISFYLQKKMHILFSFLLASLCILFACDITCLSIDRHYWFEKYRWYK